MPNASLVSALARAFLAGEATVDGIVARASRMLDQPWHWLRPLATRYVQACTNRTRPRHREVVQFLLKDRGFGKAWSRHRDELAVARQLTEPQQMHPVAVAATWPVPPIESYGALAEWLKLTPGELDWFADLKSIETRVKDRPRLRHYHYRVLEKRSGSIRLIEAPKPRLKELQRKILAEILNQIPPHSAVHGFVKGRSIRTFAGFHVGQRVVLRMDLQNFFPSIAGPRIQALFRTAGYPETVADLLGGICTNATPRDV
jgi:RNA-directed DNA polymerase